MSQSQLEKISVLPQANAIRKPTAERWLDQMANDPRLEWHIGRLNGIGGSEAIAAYVMGLKIQDRLDELPSKAAMFCDPTSVVRDKLMINTPDKGTPKMQRGNIMEPVIIDRMMEQYPLKPREDLLEKLKEASGEPEGHGWVRGTPDFVGEWTGGPNKGQLIVIDIKAPDEPHPEPLFDYICQLHHYTYLTKVSGIPVDQMALASLDWKEFDVQMKEIQWNQEIMDTILLGGQHLWEQYVMKGEVPDWREFLPESPVPKSLLTEDFLNQMEVLENDYLENKFSVEQLTENLNEVQGRFVHALEPLGAVKGIKPQDLGLVMMGVTVRANVQAEDVEKFCHNRDIDLSEAMVPGDWDGQALAEALEASGVDPEPYRKTKLNTDKLLEALKRAGVTYGQAVQAGLIKEGISPTYRTPKSGKKLETHDAMNELVESGVDALKKQIRNAIYCDEGAEPTPESVDSPAPVEPDVESEQDQDTLETLEPEQAEQPPKESPSDRFARGF